MGTLAPFFQGKTARIRRECLSWVVSNIFHLLLGWGREKKKHIMFTPVLLGEMEFNLTHIFSTEFKPPRSGPVVNFREVSAILAEIQATWKPAKYSPCSRSSQAGA